MILALIVFGTVFGVSSCALNREADTGARTAYEQLAAGDIAGLQARSAPELASAKGGAQLAEIRENIPQGQPSVGKRRDWAYALQLNGRSIAAVNYKYRYANETVWVETTVAKAWGEKTWRVTGLHVRTNRADMLAGVLDAPPYG